MKKNIKRIISLSLLVTILFFTYNIFFGVKREDMKYTTFIKQLESGKVESVEGYSKNSKTFTVKIKNKDNIIYEVSNPQLDDFKETLLKQNVKVKHAGEYGEYISTGVYCLVMLSFGVLIFRLMTQSMGQFQNDIENPNISKKTFNDVIGLDGVKSDLLNVVDMVKNPEKCKTVGAKIPKGILLDGPPGNGKTLLAKALAGECGMGFFSTNASMFIEKYAGMGASRIRTLFKQARKNSPSIIFIDEIDSIGSKRTGSTEGAEREYTQCLNALLAEMDGFNDEGQILVIAATNRAQDLDEALVRAGRFDMKFTINKPDYHDRINLIKYYLKDKKISSDVRYSDIAKETVDFSCSEIENLTNIAAFKAVERNSSEIEYFDFNNALIEILTKGKVKTENLNEHDFKITCFHEAGHAIMTLLKTEDEILRISALPSTSGIGGFTMSVPKNEAKLVSIKELKNRVLVLFAGRAAEYVMNGATDVDLVSLGASCDIYEATNIIKNYLVHNCENRGLLDYSLFDRTSSNAKIIDDCEKISNELWSECVEIINNNFVLVQNLAYKLMAEKIVYNYKLTNIDLIKEK